MTDADMENSETQVWRDFALACQYIREAEYQDLTKKAEEIGRMLHSAIEHPERYGCKDT